MSRPNILYLHSHDTGRYVQPYGHAVPTPNMQRLAGQGALFRQAYCAAPTCSPSRAGLLTGQSPHSAGMLGLAHRGWALGDPGQHLAHVLRAAGYGTALFGVQHLTTEHAALLGYDTVWTASKAAADVSAQAAAYLGSAPAQPFFLDVGFFETHRPFPEPGPADNPGYLAPPAPLPDAPETRADMAAYRASARLMDEGVGRVLAALDAAGLAESTLLICTTDHGPAFPFMKCNLTGHGTGVLLIMRGPGGFSGGAVYDALVSQIDIFPTICALIGLEPPAWLQGRSLLPIVRGEAAEVNEAVFGEVTYHAAYEPQRSVRSRRWSYIRRFGERAAPVLPNCDDGPSKELLLAQGWRRRPIAFEQLYDLLYDPQESHNLAGDPGHAAALGPLRERLEAWMRASADPLLAGPVPCPPACWTNNPDDLTFSSRPWNSDLSGGVAP